MLGRTANAIFWMYRYLERAENTARLLDAGFRMALMRGGDAASEEWRSVLATLGLQQNYDAAHDGYDGMQVCNFVLREKSHPQSIMAMMDKARNSARMSRSSITLEVWEAVNEGWMKVRELLARPLREGNLGAALSGIRRESTLVRGATYGTMMRNQIYRFARAGTFIERADNTARILDVKYHLLLPSLAYVGSSLDSTQWDNVLRSLGGERAYRWLNAGRMEPRGIAEFLIMDERFPRSLTFCYGQLLENLDALARECGGPGQSHGLARAATASLAGQDIEGIFDIGLHQFLLGFIGENQALANAIAVDYRFND